MQLFSFGIVWWRTGEEGEGEILQERREGLSRNGESFAGEECVVEML
jgi:hypothetical protein